MDQLQSSNSIITYWQRSKNSLSSVESKYIGSTTAAVRVRIEEYQTSVFSR